MRNGRSLGAYLENIVSSKQRRNSLNREGEFVSESGSPVGDSAVDTKVLEMSY